MARIYDNIESKFVQGLQELITDVAVKRVDFCVGYFNLRGWNLVVNQIDQIPGEYVDENDKQEFRRCRLLIGMHQPDEELVRQLYSTHQIPEGELTIHQLSNYTKNPLLVRVFHELHWVEDSIPTTILKSIVVSNFCFPSHMLTLLSMDKKLKKRRMFCILRYFL